jgi:protein SCO1/2
VVDIVGFLAGRHLAAALTIVVVGSALTACGGGSSAATKPADLAGGTITPRQSAPAIALRDYKGKPVTLAEQRGKVVLLTFLYTHCPDVCPLIAGNLRVVQNELKDKAKDVVMLAVSTDPRGDTPGNVAKFLRIHRMAGRMDYLIGSPAQLRPVWKRWSIAAKRGKNGLVAHSSLVYGISPKGKLISIYPANFAPSDIVHDVPILETL